MKIVYFGTPGFSLKPLEELIDSKHEIIAVVTQPDKISNRNKLIFSKVKEKATEKNIPVYQFEKIKTEGVEILKSLDADIYITCAYGQIISQEIIDIPKYGILNIHASLLPKYRGSSPIQSSILNGDKETGITIMKTALKVDSGDILLQEKIEIEDNDTAESLFEKLSILGGSTILKALDLIEKSPNFKKQDENNVSFCKMISKQDGLINFEEKFEIIERKTRAFYPWPSTYTYFENKIFKIFKISLVRECNNDKYPYLYIEDNKLLIDSKFSTFEILELQQEGAKKILAKDYINGNKFIGKKELKNGRI